MKELKINRIFKSNYVFIYFPEWIILHAKLLMKNKMWWEQCRMIVLQQKRTPKSVHTRIGGCERKIVEEKKHPQMDRNSTANILMLELELILAYIIQTQLSWFIFDFKCFHCLFIRLFLAHFHIKLFFLRFFKSATAHASPFHLEPLANSKRFTWVCIHFEKSQCCSGDKISFDLLWSSECWFCCWSFSI